MSDKAIELSAGGLHIVGAPNGPGRLNIYLLNGSYGIPERIHVSDWYESIGGLHTFTHPDSSGSLDHRLWPWANISRVEITPKEEV